jgi:hypothetical protein
MSAPTSTRRAASKACGWCRTDSAVRQLASLHLPDLADGSSDLVAAQDENQETWHYEYQALRSGQHPPDLRYTDRTGRGTHLQWKHEDGFDIALTADNSAEAKAYRERADDGSFDTTIVWNKHIRLATVIDALGAKPSTTSTSWATPTASSIRSRGADGKLYRA